MTALSESADIRVLPYPPGELERVLGAVSFYRRTVMRKGAFRGLDADVPQVAVVNILATHARVPEPVVHDAARRDPRRTAPSSVASIRCSPALPICSSHCKTDGAKALEFGGVSLHPGAVRAYREAGYL